MATLSAVNPAASPSPLSLFAASGRTIRGVRARRIDTHAIRAAILMKSQNMARFIKAW
jgi:hypothetical protein